MVVSSGTIYHGPRFCPNAVAPSNMPDMSVADETSQPEMFWLKEEAPLNIPDMSAIFETSHDEMSPLKDVALRNIPDMSVTPERSGESVAKYAMFVAPANASRIVSHCIPPHWSIETSLAALAVSPPRCIREKFPYILMVWSPGVAYWCVWLPVTLAETVPSPQSIWYAPAAPPTGMVTDSLGEVVFQVVVKLPRTLTVRTCWVALLPELSLTS